MINLSNIKFKQANSTNYQAGRSSLIKFIVIHYTANNGDKAEGNVNYFANNKNLSASAHYFVDEYDTIWQSVKDSDTAWHCGGGLQGNNGATFYKKCMNSNSIGIELCSRKDSNGNYYFKDETIANAINLTRELMQKYNIPISNIIRHYDVTGKNCPAPMVINTGLWNNFKNKLMEDKIDMEELKALEKRVADLESQLNVKYGHIDSLMPEWAREPIKTLVDNDILKGNEAGNLQLSEFKLWVATIVGRVVATLKK